MSFDLDLCDIKYICGDVIYNRAMDMYLRNKVRTIRVNENNEAIFSSTAIVQSAYDVNNYKVGIVVNNKNLKVYPNCSCEAFNKYGICKHVGAVLIKINKDGSYERGHGVNKTQEEELLEVCKNSYQKDMKKVNKEILKLEKNLVVEEYGFSHKTYKFYLELKVGSSRLYVVKNMRELLECIYKTGGTIYFGKELEYNNARYDFNNKDKELLNLLFDLYELNLQVNLSLYTNKSVFFTGKRVLLTEGNFKKFFSIMNNEKINFTYKGDIYENVVLKNSNLPLSFYVFLNEEKLNIDMNCEIPTPIVDDVGLYYLKNQLYLLSEKEQEDFAPLHKIFSNKSGRTISFKKEAIGDVANYLIPKLERLSSLVIKDDNIDRLIKKDPLVAKIYLDYDSNKECILCKVIYTYGDIEINENTKENIVRNFEEEKSILEKLHNFNFYGDGTNLKMESDEDFIDFLTYGIEEIKELGEIFYSESFKNMKVINHKSFSSGIRLNDVDLLEFDFKIEGLTSDEVKDTLDAIKKKKKYFKLKSGTIISLQGKEVNDINSIMDNFEISTRALSKGEAVLPKYASLYLDDKINNGALGFLSTNSKFKSLIENIKNIKESNYEVPSEQKSILRPYQETGFKWFKTLGDCGFGGILGDEMGLGKTLQAITYINSELVEGKLNKKAIIICPTSLVYNWSDEFEKFAPSLKVGVISGTKNEREKIIENIEGYDVLVTSYALIRRDIDFYKKHKFDICIIDEAQYIKNPKSLNASSVKEIDANKKFAMTGTPIENSLTELWSIFDFVMPGYLKSHNKFVTSYESNIVKDNSSEALNELLKLIKPFILRRFKKDVVLELPPKIEHKVLVDMTKEQKKLYYSYVQEYKNELNGEIKEKGINKSKIKILSLLTRLRQLCCDPGSFIDNYSGDSGKYIALYDILDESLENNHKVLLFSQFTTILGTIRKKLKEKGIKVMYLDGAISSKDRMDLVKEFNEGEPAVFLISLKAGGTGLNLTSADTVIHFDPWWNPAVEEQAVDRAHRIGQKNTVEVIKLIAKGTIEEKIYKIQENKKAIIEKVIDGEEHADISLSTMSEEEIEDLFSIPNDN